MRVKGKKGGRSEGWVVARGGGVVRDGRVGDRDDEAGLRNESGSEG